MNCEQVTQTVSNRLERRLRLHERLGILVHVARCPGCRAYIEQFRLTLLGLRSLPKPVALGSQETLIERFRWRSAGRIR